jgi:hypothetical protein
LKVLVSQPTTYVAGDVLSPGDINATTRELSACFTEAGGKRLQRSTVVLQFVESVGVGYTQASNVEERTFRFRCPMTCVVERAEMSANLVSSAEVRVDITSAAGATPQGATSPWLSTMGAVALSTDGTRTVPLTSFIFLGGVLSATVDVTDYNPERVLLIAGTEYKVIVSGAGTFTIDRFDVTLTLVTDRFNTSGTVISTSMPVLGLTDASARDASVLANAQTAWNSVASVMGFNVVAPAPVVFTRYNFTSGTAAAVQFFLPRFVTARAQCRVIAMDVFAYADAAASFTLSASLRNTTPSTLATSLVTVTAGTQGTSPAATLNVPLVIASAGVTGVGASDYNILLTTNNAANIRKTVVCLWLSR